MTDETVRQPSWPAGHGRVPVITGSLPQQAAAIERGRAVRTDAGAKRRSITCFALTTRWSGTSHDCRRHGIVCTIYNVVPWSYLSPQLLTRIIDDVEESSA
jgi:hypothetical protein